MVGVVKRLTRRIVAPLRAGSNPVTHPILIDNLGCSQVGKAQDFDSCMRRFEPCHPSQFLSGPLAQLAEHLTFNQGVPSSSLGWITILSITGGSQDSPVFLMPFSRRHDLTLPGKSRIMDTMGTLSGVPFPCGCGGTGRRTRLRIWRFIHAGSNPVTRTIFMPCFKKQYK